MVCRYCRKKIGPLRKLKDTNFCCDDHRQKSVSRSARAVREAEDLEWCVSRLQWKANKRRTNALDTPFRKLASAALDLLTSGELNKLSACSNPECRWLFLDGSKNKARRWCDMKLCGNRIKARRYRGRQLAVTPAVIVSPK